LNQAGGEPVRSGLTEQTIATIAVFNSAEIGGRYVAQLRVN